MNLVDLDDLIIDLGIDPTDEQVEKLYKEYKKDFVDNDLYVDGLRVRVFCKKSKVEGFEDYPETFVHLITRKNENKKRVFDKLRANKIHWVRCILENKCESEIHYFEFEEADGKIRDYFWYKVLNFMVVMEKRKPNYAIITCFHVDGEQRREFYMRRLQKFKRKKMPQLR